MLEELKEYLGAEDAALLERMLENARAWAAGYCNLSAYDAGLDPALWRMVCEDWGRAHSEGTGAKAYGGLSESYDSQYSPQVLTLLRKHRRLKRM